MSKAPPVLCCCLTPKSAMVVAEGSAYPSCQLSSEPGLRMSGMGVL